MTLRCVGVELPLDSQSKQTEHEEGRECWLFLIQPFVTTSRLCLRCTVPLFLGLSSDLATKARFGERLFLGDLHCCSNYG